MNHESGFTKKDIEEKMSNIKKSKLSKIMGDQLKL